MSAVDIESDVELIQAHEFKPGTPCEVGWRIAPKACGEAAAGIVHCLHCNLTIASSWSCWTRAVIEVTMRGTGVACSDCQTRGEFLDVFEFVPFGGTR